MTQELLPCPFCGSTDIFATPADVKPRVVTSCRNCTAAIWAPHGDWNRRAPDAAREKRMREVAEEMGNEIRAAESADSPVQPKFNEIAVIRAKAWRAKLLEGMPGFESAISEEEDLYTPPSQNIDQ